MTTALIYIDAVPSDYELLTATAFDSKKTWGYPDHLMELWKPELEISQDYISKNKVVKVFNGGRFIGFFALKLVKYKSAEIDHFWVVAAKHGQGYGRKMFQYLQEYLKKQAYRKATATADPNANGFYFKMGGRVIGQSRSAISDRFLNVYEFDV